MSSDLFKKKHSVEEYEVQQIIYGITHDMGAPLRSVIRFSELLQVRLNERLDDKEKYWLELIKTGGEKAQAMVDSLLVYSRLAKSDLTIKRIELADLMLSTFDKEKSKSLRCEPNKKIESNVCFLGENVSFLGVLKHWHLFFSNIFENALLYQPKNDKNNTIKVSFGYHLKGTQLEVFVEDNGIGVSEIQKNDLVRPFMRGQSEQDYPGLGMGLTYCQRIARINGGEISFENSALGGLKVTYLVDISKGSFYD
ncbi:sensor histidine kinase [Aliikangiella sp. IMCC44359]|uniref:sensor histidine kinase n=1 Tax=Aliikangiella sp. IMCC44359 TaxID=3459125 RepID=UPI00403A9911